MWVGAAVGVVGQCGGGEGRHTQTKRVDVGGVVSGHDDGSACAVDALQGFDDPDGGCWVEVSSGCIGEQ